MMKKRSNLNIQQKNVISIMKETQQLDQNMKPPVFCLKKAMLDSISCRVILSN